MPTYILVPRSSLREDSPYQAFVRGKRMGRIRLLVLPPLENPAGVNFESGRQGQEYLILPTGRFFDSGEYRELRREAGAWIATDEPARLRRILGLREEEPGIRGLKHLQRWELDEDGP